MFCQKCGKEIKEGTKFCENCGAAVFGTMNQNSTTNMVETAVNTAKPKPKKKRRLIIGIVAIILIVAVFATMGGGDNKYVKLVKTTVPDGYPGITYGDAFDNFFTNPTWKYFESDKNEDVVEFSGGCSYGEKNVTIRLQFVLYEEDGIFQVEYYEMDGEPQTEQSAAKLLETVFETYKKDNQTTSKESSSNTAEEKENGTFELSDYLGMTEEEFLDATGLEKNEFGMYPDEDSIAVICIDGKVNSVMINQFNPQDTFYGYGIGTTLEELEGLISNYTEIESYEIDDGTRHSYLDQSDNYALTVDVDPQGKVYSIGCAITDDMDLSDVETQQGDEDALQDVQAELSVLEQNGFDTSILTTWSQVIVSYAKFIAISSAGTDSYEPVRTMDDIISEIFEMNFASDLSYNSYTILNYYINCEIYKGITTEAAEIIAQYGVDDPWALMDEVDAELQEEI